ncbi:hypothetical protein BW730_10200 [Tessaracoccus aquimaris]|uniref:Uncharacterized protein n=1 Tax=Tessaracoccus aquimaris TaxID=1332264 RepID=A0A1Q2CNX8_9ACTN|nr:hypothetical protein [Tessaracoccus aquimaris]AQP47809.1 hypothetical protein BW730_10200 [Tessaracoccus aquimaris]
MTEQHPDVAEVAGPSSEIRWFGLVLLVGHLGLLAIGAVALWRIAGGWWVGAVAAAVFVAAYAAVWRFWLAPGSTRRLGYKERLTVNVVAGPAVIVLGSLSGLWLPALLATSVILLSDALNQRRSS